MREVMVKIGLERIDTQEGITVEALLDSGATGLVMSSEFAKKQSFKLRKLERLMQVRNIDRTFNQEGPIENTVEVDIYYQEHRKRTEIDIIGGQKWKVILGMLWLAYHNPKIDWRTGEVKMTRYLEECGKQWRLVQGKSGWEKQKEEEAKKEAERKKKEKKRKKKQKKKKTVEARKVVEEWEIWDEECYDQCLLESIWTWVKGMMTTIGCTRVVSVSTSCNRHCNLTYSSFSPSCSLMYYASWSRHVVTS